MKKYFGIDSIILIFGAAVILGSCSAFFEGIFIGGLIYLLMPTFTDIKVSAWTVLIIAIVLFFVLKFWSSTVYWILAVFAAVLYSMVMMGALIQQKPSPVWYVGVFLVTFTTSMLLHLEAKHVIE
ncbi:MAG: hypothetical protein IJK56_06695 [Firmicutes bacterium]|nr:hypothetical protein [Bacillota bacterium]